MKCQFNHHVTDYNYSAIIQWKFRPFLNNNENLNRPQKGDPSYKSIIMKQQSLLECECELCEKLAHGNVNHI